MNFGLRLLAIATLVMGLPALADAQSITRSVEKGWNSVVRDANKAAKQVGKAANDALAPKKKRKKTTKAKQPAGEEQTEPEAKSAQKPAGKKSATNDDAVSAEDWVIDRESSEAARKKATPGKQPEARQPPAEKAAAQPAKLPQAEQGWAAEKKESKSSRRDAIPSVEVVPLKGRNAKTEAKADTKFDDNLDDKSGKSDAAPQKLPITMIPPKQDGAAPATNAWTKQEIDDAKAACAVTLKGLDAVTIAEAPVREGNCGTPAPVRLVSIGKAPAVTLSPAPLVTCDLVAGLHDWMTNHIQPLARKELGGPVIKIETMSDYSCRMAYGRKGNKLSEHGRANALDIRGFVTGKGETSVVLDHWGKTMRDLAAEVAAKAAAEKAANQAADAAAASGAKSATVQDKSKITVALPSGATGSTSQAQLGSVWLGPRDKSKAERKQEAEPLLTPPEPATKKARFLHGAHETACTIFGTTLGPESNEAHRNHFHVDMAERKRTKICE